MGQSPLVNTKTAFAYGCSFPQPQVNRQSLPALAASFHYALPSFLLLCEPFALPKMGKHWSARYVCGDFLRIELKIFNNLYILYKGWQPSAGAGYWRYWKLLENPATLCTALHYTATPAACKVTPSAGRTGSENSGCAGRISWAKPTNTAWLLDRLPMSAMLFFHNVDLAYVQVPKSLP